jgi:hypothetical protein
MVVKEGDILSVDRWREATTHECSRLDDDHSGTTSSNHINGHIFARLQRLAIQLDGADSTSIEFTSFVAELSTKVEVVAGYHAKAKKGSSLEQEAQKIIRICNRIFPPQIMSAVMQNIEEQG